ncbi:MAG: pentapeptide repeat-containing protein [Microcoleus sp. PH2017_40_RAT_O_B]|nr:MULTISPECIES: pentapeptide repeat-containing protein [unclassified Microcoleus]TAG05060.1 MAG: pentapeptide repeat-containing protein [Oscillatoriales cyanobacterium]MCC3438120.1 pentapeptide repeat-containing protein [Microcoleus sp. PH2017_05_CCC_O_A]MCC3470886.1 pentapeptide repeat-containing protein [Microcoleus sp. PH2017_13_LAR_U_A]MCC3483403.1 pentapeptide repeat-containing protein [Microcoleus sp. PH2017_14_LAR_D_A]MCC3575851.1 pentapeptide repeat-containing protein [Microcoleus sp.
MNEEEEAEWIRICNSRKQVWLEEVLRRYEAGERDFSLIQVYLSDEQSKERYLSGVNLSGANFRESDLLHLVLYGQGINFSGSDLSDLDLARAHFEDADLSGANLSGACL